MNDFNELIARVASCYRNNWWNILRALVVTPWLEIVSSLHWL